MSELLNGAKRTHMCGQLRASDEGKRAVVMGFVAKYRNLGNLIFIDVRDRTGIVQVAFDSAQNAEVFAKAEGLRNEYVVCCEGVVRSRGSNINKNLPTGEIEILADELKILSEAEVAPFVICEDVKAAETLRLKYRYLDLRRAYLQQKLIMRDKITRIVRNYLSDNGFLEIETPFLGKSTPEGARDYLVPSRVHPGEFYALPQSPQLYKQLLMIAGMDRYYQVARCFRDEDLRANRQPEFTQIDMEMSYVEDSEDVMEIAEEMIKKVFSECCGLKFEGKFRRIPYAEAMARWGSDKPDTRFDLELKDLTNVVKDCGFSVFAQAADKGAVRAINAKGLGKVMTRKDIDACADFAKGYGLGGLAFANYKKEGVTASFYKFLTQETIERIEEIVGAEEGDIIFFAASEKAQLVTDCLGGLRCYLADKYSLYDKNKFDCLWIVDFTMDIPLLDSDPLAARANAYDLVINGQEAGGGSIRIHDPNMQQKMFEKLGMSDEDIKTRFGFFVDAFKYGAPPHGGLAFGLDRLVMLVTGCDNIKDVIAFPKIQNASCLMTGAPAAVDDKQLTELSIEISGNNDKK